MMRTLAIVSAFICLVGSLLQPARAQDPKPGLTPSTVPVPPIPVKFRVVPQFFRQLIPSGSQYSAIDAFVDNDQKNPWYEIILREKASNQQVYYSNSQKTVSVLTDRGEQAHYTSIDFHSSQGSDSRPVFVFRFQDSSRRPIQWNFVTGPVAPATAGTSGFLARPDDSGFVLLYRRQQFSAAEGTVVSIGDEKDPAGQNTFYAPDVLLVSIPPITEQLNVDSTPSQVQSGAKWAVLNKSGTESELTIQSVSADQLVLETKDSEYPDSAIRLNVRQSGSQFGLNSMSVTTAGHQFRISFDPALPLPAAMTKDTTQVAFKMDEDTYDGVASGRLIANRGLGDEHLQWQFSTPDWAKPKRLNTGVNILFGTDAKDLKKVPMTQNAPSLK